MRRVLAMVVAALALVVAIVVWPRSPREAARTSKSPAPRSVERAPVVEFSAPPPAVAGTLARTAEPELESADESLAESADGDENGSCHGRIVYEDGEPVRGVRVALFPYLRLVDWEDTDDDGRFRMDEIPLEAKRYTLRVGPKGQAIDAAEVDLRPDADVEVNATVARGYGTDFEILDAKTGSPIAEAVVWLWDPNDSQRDAAVSPFQAASDVLGRTAFSRLPSASFHFRVLAGGFEPVEGDVEMPRPPSGVHRVALPPLPSLVVRLVGWSELWGSWREFTNEKGAFEVSLRDLESNRQLACRLDWDARSTPEKETIFAGVAPRAGRFAVDATTRMWNHHFEDVVLVDGETRELTIEVGKGVWLTGHVVDAEGETLRFVRVELRGGGKTCRSTGADPILLQDVEPGEYAVDALVGQTWIRDAADPLVVGTQNVEDLVIRLGSSAISGRIVGSNSRGAARVRLERLTDRGFESAGYVNVGAVRRGYQFALPSGVFAAKCLRAGAWRLTPLDMEGSAIGPSMEVALLPGADLSDIELHAGE